MNIWLVKHRFIAGSHLDKWSKTSFHNLKEALSFCEDCLLEGEEVRIFDRNLKVKENV